MEQYISFDLYKPLMTGLVSVAIDRYYFNRQNLTQNLGYGFAVGAGQYGGQKIGEYYLPQGDYKSAEVRAVEVSTGLAGAYAIDKFLTQTNSLNARDAVPRIASIILTDLGVEYLRDQMY